MTFRIALLGITHESNTFVKEVTTLNHFSKGHWLKGADIRQEYMNAYHEIGGMIEVLDREGMEVIPVMYAEATPGGTISSEAYSTLLNELLNELENILPVDGCLVVPHGAAVSESFADMDGHWLSAVRERLGDLMPVIGTIDPHANVSRSMTDATNALVAYKTNPHIDQRETGREAAELLVKMLKNKIKPLQILNQLPLAISIEQQCTEKEPCKSLYAYARALSRRQGILSVSIVLGFPYADVREMGSSIIVVSDNDKPAAIAVANLLEDYILESKSKFNGSKQDISLLLSSLEQCEKPVLMLDMGDNIGGGSSGDSVFLLDRLEDNKTCKFFICIYDPKAVYRTEKYSPGESFEMAVGSRTDLTYNIVRPFTLIRHCDGKFIEETPRHGGQLNFDMGRTAIVSTAAGNVIMLTSLRVPPFSLRQLTAFDIVPEEFDVLVAKGVNAPIAAYAPVCKTILQVNTPGDTQADMTTFSYKNRRKPLFPFEEV